MGKISNVTLKGVKVEQQPAPQPQAARQRNVERLGMMGWLMGAVVRQPKVSPSLAFIDSRTDTAVVVSNDTSFGDLNALQDALILPCARQGGG